MGGTLACGSSVDRIACVSVSSRLTLVRFAARFAAARCVIRWLAVNGENWRAPVLMPVTARDHKRRVSARFVFCARVMTQPRCVQPGAIVMITRRTLRRTHLLRPDRELNNLFLYCLAVVSQRFDIHVHAAVVMSTHEHLIVTDTRGQLPRFLQEFHRLFALGVKVLRAWEGAVWDHDKTSVVELRTVEAVIEKLAYVMANPVAAGLVRSASQWPGVTTAPEQLGRVTFTAARPDCYFDSDNPAWPETARLSLVMPACHVRGAQLRVAVANELAYAESQARASVNARGWKVAGRERVTRLSPYERAASWEPLRGRNPTFAVGRGQREAFGHAVAMLRGFRRAYRDAIKRWRTGVRDAVFPAGTWLMRCVHLVTVAATVL
jgi:putative transposase